MRNRGMSLLELLIVLAILGLFIAILLPAFAHAKGFVSRNDCAANLKQLGLASAMFAREDAHGNYPTLYATETRLVSNTGEPAGGRAFLVLPCLNPGDLYPDYVIDPAAFICPGLAESSSFDGAFDAVAGAGGRLLDTRGLGLAARSYMYLGWAVDQIAADAPQESLEILGGAADLSAPAQLVLGVGPVLDELKRTQDPSLADRDIPVPGGMGTSGGTLIRRLREGIERFGVTDINSTAPAAKAEAAIWVLSDRVTVPEDGFGGGANVLFKDGHVEFVTYPEKAPVTPGMAHFLDAIQ
ncbi:MAG TPA: prepilin-type N-terminal cleavage/methylation domain-containing protein [Candidatus Hydrogenedentes bacterium]|nr:prepilin-type N-terminal cleavage/methylation domain-containing protein [Candidatus Hydrogenedentota bacterium]HQE81519.1 prepilin-type N-terminal cleavage/methylation domain-containing protein [Candidatus Hydrogenedentota bacterium]HQH51354.1 prepilin-type N-terminal cleavage/methylation domain-containing protein [Candidatus Hydrogenedentota bacterium]HQM49514.1 prepilin-type N-terminal cleavage/methylation domain-containing protein [Candidatus Hydrogenedentota bacterium]